MSRFVKGSFPETMSSDRKNGECLQYFLDIRGPHPLPMHVFVWDWGGAMAQRRGKVGRRCGVWGSVCVGVCVSE